MVCRYRFDDITILAIVVNKEVIILLRICQDLYMQLFLELTDTSQIHMCKLNFKSQNETADH